MYNKGYFSPSMNGSDAIADPATCTRGTHGQVRHSWQSSRLASWNITRGTFA